MREIYLYPPNALVLIKKNMFLVWVLRHILTRVHQAQTQMYG
jgi:hypothetical protein